MLIIPAMERITLVSVLIEVMVGGLLVIMPRVIVQVIDPLLITAEEICIGVDMFEAGGVDGGGKTLGG